MTGIIQTECDFTLSINSADRQSGTASSFSIFLNKPIKVAPGYSATVFVRDVSVPYSWYSITSTNNSFTVNENNAGIYRNYNVVIPVGNYDADSYITTLTSQLAIYSAASGYGLLYTITLDAGTNKMTIKGSNAVITISFTFTANSLYKQCGFNVGTTAEVSSTTGLTSSNVCDLTGVHMINIRSPTLSNLWSYTSTTKSVSTSIASIATNCNPFGYITSYTDCGRHRLPDSANINQLEFQLTDNAGTILDLNGLDYTFNLVVEVRVKNTASIDNRGILDR